MKLNKLAFTAVAAALALGAFSAKASIGIVTNYSKLTVSGLVTTNVYSASGNLEKWTAKTAKFGNKQLLDLFAHWDGTTWPTGAQLVVGWDSIWDGDVLVVDKTGTNVLYDASTGSGSGAAYFYVDFDDEEGCYSEAYLDASPGYESWTEQYTADFELYDDDYYLPYTYFSAYGGNAQKFKQSWDANGNYTTWSDSESAVFPNNGDQYWLDFGSETTVSGKIGASGKGKGMNWYWF
jgi:hypothetical protein